MNTSKRQLFHYENEILELSPCPSEMHLFFKNSDKIPLPEFDVVVRICFYKLHNNDRPEIVCTSVEGITLSKTKLLKISRGKNGRQINLTST